MAACQHEPMNLSLGFDLAYDIAQRMEMPAATEALSGARFERVVLTDGRRLVFKRLPPAGDWLTRLTGGAGHLRHLWDGGTLAEVAATVEHSIVAIVNSNGADVVVMRDMADCLLPAVGAVSRATAWRLLTGLAALHRAWEGRTIDRLCRPAARYQLFAPRQHASDRGPNPHPNRALILSGWQTFAEMVPTDVADAVLAIHAHPEPLADALVASAPATLVHGDAKLENLGLEGERVVAIDWGELTGIGPAEIDVAWFAVMSGWRLDCLPDEVFAAYEQQASRRLEPRALDLACIGSLAQMGFKLAARSVAPDEPTRARATALLDWWVARVRRALSATGLPD